MVEVEAKAEGSVKQVEQNNSDHSQHSFVIWGKKMGKRLSLLQIWGMFRKILN